MKDTEKSKSCFNINFHHLFQCHGEICYKCHMLQNSQSKVALLSILPKIFLKGCNKVLQKWSQESSKA